MSCLPITNNRIGCTKFAREKLSLYVSVALPHYFRSQSRRENSNSRLLKHVPAAFPTSRSPSSWAYSLGMLCQEMTISAAVEACQGAPTPHQRGTNPPQPPTNPPISAAKPDFPFESLKSDSAAEIGGLVGGWCPFDGGLVPQFQVGIRISPLR